jgi:type I restriction enzyme R subunit
VQAARRRGKDLGLTEEELAFYDTLETNNSAVQLLGDEYLRAIASGLVKKVWESVIIDWTVRENIRRTCVCS